MSAAAAAAAASSPLYLLGREVGRWGWMSTDELLASSCELESLTISDSAVITVGGQSIRNLKLESEKFKPEPEISEPEKSEL
jgi:hypothetical protein